LKQLKIKFCALLLIISTVGCIFASCGNKKSEDAVELSFKSASSYDYLKEIDGEKVTINGYMATSSPVDGSFIFLMNLPYQSCPFCIPNTTELSNTIEVYPAKGEDFTAFTNQAIKVVGTLEVAENEDEPFEDEFGYKFNFKIIDATFTIIKAEELSSDMALFQRIADSGVVNEIYNMYDYVNFVTAWNTYYINNYTDADGNLQPGYYLWPDDAMGFIYTDGAQYNYGYKDGYFDGIVKKLEAIDKEAFADLIENVRAAEALANKALAELEAGNYTSEIKYIEMFGVEDHVYTLDKGEELTGEMESLYKFFSDWLGSLEL
jgi:hypothetical protein